MNQRKFHHISFNQKLHGIGFWKPCYILSVVPAANAYQEWLLFIVNIIYRWETDYLPMRIQISKLSLTPAFLSQKLYNHKSKWQGCYIITPVFHKENFDLIINILIDGYPLNMIFSTIKRRLHRIFQLNGLQNTVISNNTLNNNL